MIVTCDCSLKIYFGKNSLTKLFDLAHVINGNKIILVLLRNSAFARTIDRGLFSWYPGYSKFVTRQNLNQQVSHPRLIVAIFFLLQSVCAIMHQLPHYLYPSYKLHWHDSRSFCSINKLFKMKRRQIYY